MIFLVEGNLELTLKMLNPKNFSEQIFDGVLIRSVTLQKSHRQANTERCEVHRISVKLDEIQITALGSVIKYYFILQIR